MASGTDGHTEKEGSPMVGAAADTRGSVADVIYIRDDEQQLALRRTTIGGVDVYTVMDPEKVRQLRERFGRMVAPPDPPRSWYERLRTWLG